MIEIEDIRLPRYDKIKYEWKNTSSKLSLVQHSLHWIFNRGNKNHFKYNTIKVSQQKLTDVFFFQFEVETSAKIFNKKNVCKFKTIDRRRLKSCSRNAFYIFMNLNFKNCNMLSDCNLNFLPLKRWNPQFFSA